MNAQGLLASAGINIGLAIVVLTFFSIFKKQLCSAPVYLPKKLATGGIGPLQEELEGSGFSRFLPSASWSLRALRLSEDEFLQTCGLDALVILRLFKLGIKLFTACSAIGLLVLLPVNYTSEHEPTKTLSHSMDSFTMSNIGRGSNRLWVHFFCLYFISFYSYYLLYQEYKNILTRRIEWLNKDCSRPDQFTVIVREIPVCTEHHDIGCCVDHFFSKHHPFTYQWHMMAYDGQHIEELMELPVAFVSFKSRWGAAIAAQTQQYVNPLLWITEMAPEPRDVLWHNLAIPYGNLVFHKIGVSIAASLLTIFFAFPVTAVQGIVQLESIKKWFPPVRALQLIPGLASIVTGYLPSVILNSFIYCVPFAMLGLSSLEGCMSRSKKEIKACSMVYYFLVGNVFFLSLLSGSLLYQIGESFTHPRSFPSRLASAVSA
ncbi:hypothetical protein AMTRI_Chr01g107590 [Amborella trichopoda]